MEARLVGSGLGEDSVVWVVIDHGVCPVGGLELGGCDVGKLAVETSMVVPVDVGGDGEFDVVDTAPAAAAQDGVADAFGFEQEFSASAMALS